MSASGGFSGKRTVLGMCLPVRVILESIELHHTAGSDRSIESVLLRDADALDFLGVVGICRDFSKNPLDLRKALQAARQRQEKLPAMLSLEKARAIANERVEEMDRFLSKFEEDSFGLY